MVTNGSLRFKDLGTRLLAMFSSREFRRSATWLAFACLAAWSPAALAETGLKNLPVVDQHDIRFTRLSSRGEILARWIRGIVQDNQGFLWFLSDGGLFRYDGYNLRPFHHDPNDPNTIGSNQINTLYKDRAGVLWIGTATSGLDRLDPVRGTVAHYRHKPGVKGSLPNNSILSAYEDRSGALWIGTNGGGLARLDPGAKTFTHYQHDSRDTSTLSGNTVVSVKEDRRGNLWVGTTTGLNLLNRTSGRFTRFVHDDANPRSLGDNFVGQILEDHSGTIWLASPFANGLTALDVERMEFTRYSFHSDEHSDEEVVGVAAMHEDADGSLWLGTVKDGLLRLDPKREQFLRYTSDPANPASLSYIGVATIFEDREGVIWLGGRTGVSYFTPNSPGFFNYTASSGVGRSLADNGVWSVQEDHSGGLWIGTETALHRLDRRTGRIRIFRNDPNDPNSLSHNTVSAIREDESGNLWFGTYGGGLNRYNPTTGRFSRYRHDPTAAGTLSGDLILSLMFDRDGILWVGTQGKGLNRYDPRTGMFQTYHHIPDDPRSLSVDTAESLLEDRSGRLWVASHNELNLFDRESQQFEQRFPQDSMSLQDYDIITAIQEDREGRLWLGTRNGLLRVDPSTSAHTRFTMQDGLPDNSVTGIVEDRAGELWLATKYGLSRFSVQTGKFHNYFEHDGLPSNQFNAGPEGACRTSDGSLAFGTASGLTVFDPAQLTSNLHVPPVVLTDFQLFNETVKPGEGSLLHQPIEHTGRVTLAHSQNVFAIEFAALSYTAPSRNRYRYRLEGLEEKWNEVDSSRRIVTYTSLPSGDYVFRVQGSNGDLVWNESGASLAITILPPWWATMWFRIAMVLCAVAIILAAYRIRVRGLHRAAAMLELEVEKRTRELESARIAADEANRTKDKFLSHMSHELRTPLSSILGFSKVLQSDKVSEEHRSGLDLIHRSGTHLLMLVNEVLNLAKLDSGQESVDISPCNLRDLAIEVADLMRSQAKAKALDLRLELPGTVPSAVLTDCRKLQRVLFNLLGNAIRHTNTGSVTLRLDIRSINQADSVLAVLAVEDTGEGISEEDQARIFEPFVQVGEKHQHSGTGLGLAISREYLALLGGTIHVQSVLGGGSTFQVELPVKLAAQSPAEGQVPAPVHFPKLAPGQSARRVLVAEDDSGNRVLLRCILQKIGFEVQDARNGEEAIQKFLEWQPAFIWMDLHMPVLDGYSAARRIRAFPGGTQVKIAATSAGLDSQESPTTDAAEFDAFVSKPFLLEEVYDCMAIQLGLQLVDNRRDQNCNPSFPSALENERLCGLPDDL